MAEDPLFIEDGYTRTHFIAAIPGIHPSVEVRFRPALARERREYEAKLATKDPEKVDRYETDLIGRYVVEINGESILKFKDTLGRLTPAVKRQLVDVILSFDAAREAEDARNLSSG